MDATDLAHDLASIPSHESEAAVGDFIADWLRDHTDATVTRDDAGADEGRGGNVVAHKGSGDRTLAFVGHHDVVPPDDGQVDGDGYVVERRDGRLHGRGTADMKGAVAAAMVAFAEADPAGELAFASFVGEEVGGVGARVAIDDGFAPDYAIVGEGSTGYSADGVTDVAIAHKGRRGSTVTARGEAAHASEVDEGENAIYRATDAVAEIRDLEFPSTSVLGHDLTGSVAVTEIDGGTAMNVVPDRCAVTVDERTVPGERADVGRVETIDGVAWTADQDLPPMQCGDEAFADAVLAAADAAQDGDPEHVVKPHATDAGWLSQAGTDCVICGVAEPGEAHTAAESASLSVIERCADIYRRVAETVG
ncbi:M20 family metallopeptidase [Halorientalis litorea]|uniref:M20 family metallopeptidase n=1 Tax=Halorientalis litorea TaxID=2931977 RepID=UPI001FF4625B|nr:M20/M25/M40 family metallo-hydrolase [Halorientalis litorea]